MVDATKYLLELVTSNLHHVFNFRAEYSQPLPFSMESFLYCFWYTFTIQSWQISQKESIVSPGFLVSSRIVMGAFLSHWRLNLTSRTSSPPSGTQTVRLVSRIIFWNTETALLQASWDVSADMDGITILSFPIERVYNSPSLILLVNAINLLSFLLYLKWKNQITLPLSI